MSLNWQSIRDNPFALLTAPLLCLIVFLLSMYIYSMEKKTRTEPNTATIISILSDQTAADVSQTKNADHRETDKRVIETKQFKAHIESLLKAANAKGFALKTELTALKREYTRSEYQQLLIITARKATQNEQYFLANEIFAEIGRKYFDDDLTGFFRAFALDKVDDYRLAKRTYEWQLERHPNHQSSAMNYGLLLLKMQLDNEAVAALQHAITITSGKRKAKSLRFLARAYAQKDDTQDAIKAIQKSILFEPDKSQSWTLLAELLSQKLAHSRQEVVDAHNKAIALSSKNYRPYYSLGSYLFSQLEFEQARKPLATAHKLAKQNHTVALIAGVNLYASGRPYSAQRVMKELAKEEGTENTLYGAAYFLVQKEYKQAKKVLSNIQFIEGAASSELYGLHEYLRYEALAKIENVQQENPNTVTSLPNLKPGSRFYYPGILAGVHFQNSVNADELALRDSQKLVERLPQSAEALLLHARTLVKNDRTDEALLFYARAQTLQPESRRISIDYIELLKEEGQTEKALTIVERLLEAHPRYTHAMLLKATILALQNKPNEAKEILEIVISMDRSNVAARSVLADLHSGNGDNKLALGVLSDLLSIESANINARIQRSNILINDNQYTKALEELERVLKLDSGNVTALALKNKLLENTKKTLETQVDG